MFGRTALVLAGAAVITALSAASAQARVWWVWADNGYVPPGAIVGGFEAYPGRQPLYLCRGAFRGGWHPGKLRPAFRGCNISWGGREIRIGRYQALVGGDYRWINAADGQIPFGALPAGAEASPGRQTLYICRARFRGGLHPGKVRPAFGACNISWGGREWKVPVYQVLVTR
jgi:hypothetical protein